MDQELLKQLAVAMAANSKATSEQMEILQKLAGMSVEKTAATTMTANPLHGWNGLFSTPGLERDILSAHIRPMGIADKLPLLPSVDQDPRYGSITGFTAPVGSQPANACDDAPYNYMKGCNLTARFGRIRYDTNTVEMDKVMLKVNRGDFTDLQLHGQILGLTNVAPNGLNPSQILNIITMAEMVKVGVLFEREITRQLWQGVVTVANEFPGLAVQVATGQKDADTGTLCPALDSDVKSYGYNLLSSSIVTYMSMLEFYIYNNAMRTGVLPVQWVWAMRPELWQELTEIWPCAYNTNRCHEGLDSTQAVVSVDGREMVALRDSMRASLSISINGRTYPVVLDDGIFEHNNINNANCKAGEYASTIYFLPLSITGGFPVLYRQYVDYTKAVSDISLLKGMETFWTDGGIYSWALEQIKWCYKLAAKTEQRIVLRAPWLAGRIDAVKYSPLQHLRSPFADDAYFADGGISIRNSNQAAYYSAWNGR